MDLSFNVRRARVFGSRLIENGLARELDGRVQLEFRPTGIECIVDSPLGANEGAL
jgi:two-component sensor histidine kinase